MKNNVLLGLFVTVAVLLFTVGIYYIGNRQNLFGTRFYISAVFDDVKGLQPGNNVRYAGIDVGTVNQIVLLNDSAVQVDMALDPTVVPFLRRDAVARVGSDGLVGNIIIMIGPGPGRLEPVRNGDVIDSYRGMETEELLDAFGRTNEHIAQLTQNLITITEEIYSGSGTVGLLLRDTVLATDLRHSIAHLNQTTRTMRDIGAELHQVVNNMEQGKGLAGGLLTDTVVMSHLRASSGQIDTLLSQQVEPLLSELQTTGATLSAFSTDLERLTHQLNEGRGPVGALLGDSLMQQDLRQTLENINQGTARFNENMEAMKHNFLFRGYFRKQEKRMKKG